MVKKCWQPSINVELFKGNDGVSRKMLVYVK
uniref:Uncharacterized protein n=1 Tax=Setaria italica TaxID=4555 RepID=K4A481_SETIT